MSRYLVQCATHHYFRTQVPFVKTRWVRTISFPVFSYFISIAARMYGDIPIAKGEDDGSLLTLLLKQSRFPSEYRAAKWEQVKDVVEKYKVRSICLIACGVVLIEFPSVHPFLGQGASPPVA